MNSVTVPLKQVPKLQYIFRGQSGPSPDLACVACRKQFQSRFTPEKIFKGLLLSSYELHLHYHFFSLTSQLFAEILIEDPVLVQDIALSLLEERADEERKEGRERQLFILDSFSLLLELITLRHRLIEVATESSQLARLVD